MSTCRWLWETERQVAKLTVSDVTQNPEKGKVFEAYIDKLPGDQLGFHLNYGLGETEYWSAWVIWEIEGGPHGGDILIEVLSNGLSSDELPYHDEMTGKRFWQVSIEKDEMSVEMIKIVNDKLEGWSKDFGVPLTKFNDQLQKAELREHRHSGDDPEQRPFTDERGEFDPGD